MIIDERKELDILKSGKNKNCSAIKAIWLLAKEQSGIKGKDKKQMIYDIEQMLSPNGNDKGGVIRDYNRVKYINDVESIVDRCRKNNYSLKVVESVYISKDELDKILQLRTLTLQRLAFAFLFNAKVEDAKRGVKLDEDGNEIPFGHNVYKKTGVLFGEAISSKKYSKLEKEIMVGELIREGYLELKNVHSKGNLFRKVLFIDESVNENNFEFCIRHFDNYIFEFDNYIGEGNYKRCEVCGKMIKKTSNKVKYCKECKEISDRENTKERVKKYRNL